MATRSSQIDRVAAAIPAEVQTSQRRVGTWPFTLVGEQGFLAPGAGQPVGDAVQPGR